MPTISSLAASFARTQRAEGKAPRTIRTYAAAIATLRASTGDVDVSSLTRRVVSDYVLDRSERVAPATISIEFRALRVFFGWCVLEEEITVSPMAKLRQPRVPVLPVPTFSDAELAKLYAACEGRSYRDRRDMAMLRLLSDAGVRLGELASVTLENVSLDQQVAVVTGKGKTRYVAFGAKTLTALDRWIRIRRETPTLFGMTGSGIHQTLSDRARKAGVTGWHAHRHRHTMAHRWLSAGGSETDLMSLAGWSSRSLLDRYGASNRSERAIAAHHRLFE